MRTFHGTLAYFVVALNLGAAIWGLAFVQKNLPAPKSFLQLVVAGQVALFAQVVAGVIFLRQIDAGPGLHVFYGFVLLIAAALSWALRSGTPRRQVVVSSAAALFVGAVSIRTMLTAGR